MGSKRNKKRNMQSKAVTNHKIFRRTAMATALAVATAPVNIALAGSVRNTPWGRNIDFFIAPSTDREPHLGAQLLQPLFGNAEWLTYGDLRALYNTNSTTELNIALGHRRYYGNNWLLGGYLSFDTRLTDRNKRHNELTFGLEALSVQWDANFNYYLPISDPKVVGVGTSGGTFAGNSFFANGVVEEALEGFDVEIGTLVPFVTPGETRFYVGGYNYEGEVAPNTGVGVKTRLELRPRKDIILGFSVQHDELFGTETQFQIKYSFGYPRESGVRTLDERMIQFHERDLDVKETSSIPDRKMESSDPAFRTVVFNNNVIHIDNVKGTAGGNGSYERPYDSFATCIGKRCDRPDTVIYVGANGKASTLTNYDTTSFSLSNRQSLFGRGVKLFGFGGDAFPTLTSAGDTVILARDNEIAGFRFDAAGNNAIYGFNSTGFNIHNNLIQNSANNGISLFYDESTPRTVTGVINNNAISGNGNNGVYVYTSIFDNRTGVTSQTFDITNNAITNNGNNGVFINSYLYNNNHAGTRFNQTFNITGNKIVNNANDGIYIGNYIGDLYTDNRSSLIQVVNIADNNISNNGGNGIHVYNETDTDASFLSQRLTITNNTIINNGSDGIFVDFYNDYNDSQLNFKGIITGNTITGNGDDGIDINFDTYESSRNNIDILIDNNKITGNAGNGIYMYFDNAYTYNGNQKVVISNNDISNNGSSGIYIFTHQTSLGVTSQSFLITNNTINNNGNYGIKINNDVYVWGTGGVIGDFAQSITISDNSINNNGSDGVKIYNDLNIYDPGDFTQNIHLFGNTIKNNANDGVKLWHYNPGDGFATQKVLFTNNTITGNGSYDVGIYNASNTYSIQYVTSGGGNTIGTIYVDGDGTQSVTLP